MAFSINDTQLNNTLIMSLCQVSCFIYCYAERRYAERHYSERRYAERCYADCRYVECRYAEYWYAECRGANVYTKSNNLLLKVTCPLKL